ncbi:glycerol-3-phosphate O-acyltransferase [Flagelloscypha sp. PMI_526]|nr:glycerol-3-phosphate O-acyltransferase [Flagelloscypha sp. PMI_526]
MSSQSKADYSAAVRPKWSYDAVMLLWRVITSIFFREIRPRGAFNIPKVDEGPVIFVGAPHNNQFLDLNLGYEVYKETGRRVRFLVAAASMKRRVIGDLARMIEGIPVERAGDAAKPGLGKLLPSPTDPTLIIGEGTSFKKEVTPKMQILLPKTAGSLSAEVVEVISDTELRIKKEFGGGDKLKGIPPTTYKIVPVIDQADMYKNVYQCLQEGGSFGIFPEGGSHDRTDLLPLKAGVAIMALGAMANNPNCKVRIVPVGLSYFHPHRFRSRAVIEFGKAFDVPPELVEKFKEGGPQKREAVAKFLDTIYESLKTVTVRAPDYDTLMLIQAARRLYKTPGQHLTLGQVVELNRRLVEGYIKFKDEPKVAKLRGEVTKYNRLLRDLGVRDHQVPRAPKPGWKTLGLLGYRVALLTVWTVFALPGTVLNGPIFILASIISKKKAKEALAKSTVKIAGRDVLATWKVLIALVVTPLLYTVYACVALWISIKARAPLRWKIATPFIVATVLPIMNFAALKFGEAGMDVLKSIRPLILALLQPSRFNKLLAMREHLSNEVASVINEFGPQLYSDFDEHRILHPSSAAPPSISVDQGVVRRHSSTGAVDAQGMGLTHPMTWLDERLFGWSRSSRRGSWGGETPLSVGTPNDSDDEDGGDYEPVLRVIDGLSAPSSGLSGLKKSDSRSRQGSYADLQRLKMTAGNASSSSSNTASTGLQTPGHSHDGELYHRHRHPSLADSISVSTISGKRDRTDDFVDVTRELNEEAGKATS